MPVASDEEIKIPDQEARDFTLTESAAGTKNWTLRAEYAAMFNREHRVDAKTIQVAWPEGAMATIAHLGAVRTTLTIGAQSGVLVRTDGLEGGQFEVSLSNGLQTRTVLVAAK